MACSLGCRPVAFGRPVFVLVVAVLVMRPWFR
jgi:hypothetical protein